MNWLVRNSVRNIQWNTDKYFDSLGINPTRVSGRLLEKYPLAPILPIPPPSLTSRIGDLAPLAQQVARTLGGSGPPPRKPVCPPPLPPRELVLLTFCYCAVYLFSQLSFFSVINYHAKKIPFFNQCTRRPGGRRPATTSACTRLSFAQPTGTSTCNPEINHRFKQGWRCDLTCHTKSGWFKW